MSSRLQRVVAAVGVLLAVAALAFLVSNIADSWDEVSDAVSQADPGWLILAATLAVAAMTMIAVGWWRTIGSLDGRLDLSSTIARYYVGEIGKYLPGGVWPLIGRGELAARAGVDRAVAYGSVGVSLIALYLAAGLLVAALLPFLSEAGESTPLWPLLSIPVGIVLLAGGVLERLRLLGERVARRPINVSFPVPRACAALVVTFMPAWLLIGASTWAVTRALTPDAPVAPIIAAATLSWLAGFVAVPVPGGVGVREAVFVAAVPDLSVAIATTVAIAARLLFVLVDAGGWAIGSAWLARSVRAGRRSG